MARDEAAHLARVVRCGCWCGRAAFYKALNSSELGHFKVFLKLAAKAARKAVTEARWQEMLEVEARILASQAPGPRIHSGFV